MRHHIPRILAAIATLALLAGAGAAKAQSIVVGGKNFTEQLLMAEMTTQLLESKGFDVDKRDGMGSTTLRRAQVNGQIDVYWEYTGTSLVVYNKVEERLSADETYQRVKKLDAEKGLTWLEATDANNTYALAMQEKDAADRGIQTISELAERIKSDKDLTVAVNAEFSARPDGLPGLEDHYGFDVPRDQLKRMDSGLTYQALKEGETDVALVFATDGRIAAFNFEVLEDDKRFFPAYNLAPVVRKDTLEANPELEGILNGLAAKLDAPTLRKLNKRVDVDGVSIEKVAESFLGDQGLI